MRCISRCYSHYCDPFTKTFFKRKWSLCKKDIFNISLYFLRVVYNRLGFSIGFKPVLKNRFYVLSRFAKNRCFSIKKPEIRILFFNSSEKFFIKSTCTCTHDNINLFLRETQNGENRIQKTQLCLLALTLTNNKRVWFLLLQKGE
jgi:hypothetical protein